MPDNYLTPINRNNLFYSDEDFDFETDLVMGYMEEDTNQTVIVYEVDRDKTDLSSIYRETNGNIRYKPPKEIPCLFEIADSELKAYDSSNSKFGICDEKCMSCSGPNNCIYCKNNFF